MKVRIFADAAQMSTPICSRVRCLADSIPVLDHAEHADCCLDLLLSMPIVDDSLGIFGIDGNRILVSGFLAMVERGLRTQDDATMV